MHKKVGRFLNNNFLTKVKNFFTATEETIDILTIKGFVQDLLFRMKRVEMTAQGAQLAYFFLLSFFPLLIFSIQLLPYLNLQQEAIFNLLMEIMPKEVYTLAEGTLLEILTNQNTGILSIGILGTIWSASAGIGALLSALNKAYDTEARVGIINKAFSLLLTVSLVVALIAALLLQVFGQQITIFMLSFLGVDGGFITLWNNIRLTIPPILIFTVLMGIYWIVPNTNPRLRFMSVWPGAIFVTVGWLVLSKGFSEYINHFSSYSKTYGSIGGVIIFMLWLYFTGNLLILGGLLNATIQKYTKVKNSNRNLE